MMLLPELLTHVRVCSSISATVEPLEFAGLQNSSCESFSLVSNLKKIVGYGVQSCCRPEVTVPI